MADNQAHLFPKPSIQILPDEILLKIFSFVPLDELESSVGLTCKRWLKIVRDSSLRRILKVTMNYENNRSHLLMKRTLFDRLERYREKIQHVKILTHRGHVLELSEFYELTYRHEVTLLGDITLFENISRNCLRILHLEVMLSQSVDEIRTEDLIEHPTLEVVSIVILQSCMSSVRSDLHCKFVKGRNSLDISVKNIGPSQWGKWVSKRKIDERCVLQYLSIFEFSHPIRYKNYVNGHGLFNFLTLCNCCPKMEKLVINIRSILSETEFSNLLKLKNLFSRSGNEI